MDNALKYTLDRNFDLYLVPKRPGVYIFMDAQGKAIYVGKAKSLRSRISSYLRPGVVHPAKTELMLQKARFLDVIITTTEKEALILEAQLIGDLKPRYNIRLRDDKSYPFLRIGIRSPFPRISMVRKRAGDGALYFGPFTSSLELKKTMNLICSLFRLRTCTDSYMKARTRPCLKYQVDKCSAPCLNRITKDDYQRDVERVKAFLRGKTTGVISSLKKEMEEAASILDFERAAVLRDSIRAIENMSEGQNVVSSRKLDMDVIFIELHDMAGQAAVLKVREGILKSKQVFGLDMGIEDKVEKIYSRFMTLFYAKAQIPKEVVVPEFIPEDVRQEIANYLSRLKGSKVSVRCAKSGIRKNLVKTAMLNASQKLGDELSRLDYWNELRASLKRELFLKRLPEHVEGIDISNTFGADPVGSLVCFKAGAPAKDCYRHYNIRVEGPDDYAMIGEVLSRRIKRGLEKGDLPDLVLIDGGKGQLAVAVNVAREMGVIEMLDLVSIAKARGDKDVEKIYLVEESDPLLLPRESDVLRFCQRVRDEAHRFGVTHHRKRRAIKSLASRLADIPGVGPKRERMILQHFGSYNAVSKASLEDLEEIPGLPKRVARSIYNSLRAERQEKCQR